MTYLRKNGWFLCTILLAAGCGAESSERAPLGPDEQPVDRPATKLGKADGFDWGSGCKDGQGSFSQLIERKAVVTMGTIPAGMTDVEVSLTSDQDVDVQLFDLVDGTKVVGWPEGLLSSAGPGTVGHKGVQVSYSGYNGDGTHYGHEKITIQGTLAGALVMKAYGYAEGMATIQYSWKASTSCSGGSGSFTKDLPFKDTVTVGDIPAGLKNVKIQLKAATDLDIQLYDATDGTKVVHWPDGLLSGSAQSSTQYRGVQVSWSGFNGDGTGAGNEWIKIDGTTENIFTMKVYAFQAGTAVVTYSWEDQVQPDPCAGVACTPPPPVCDGDEQVIYTASTCVKETGTCEHQSTRTACPSGCKDGACLPDPFDGSVCSGPFVLPVTGPLVFKGGSKKTYSRSCDALGKCSNWTLETSHSVSAHNGKAAFALYPDGGVSLSMQVGASYSIQSGSSTYSCKDLDLQGGGELDPATGLGTGTMQSGYKCNISNGSGGPYSLTWRDVRFHLGTTCLAVVDVTPNPNKAYHTQRRSVISLGW